MRRCKSFNSTWPRLAFCQTTMRSFDWREDHDDAGLVWSNEYTRACAFMDCCRLCVGAGDSFHPELDLWRAGSRPQRTGRPQSDVGRASALRERTRSLDSTRTVDRATS